MKVCLISLPHPYLKQPGAQVPLGILYLAAVLEKAGVKVVVKNYSSFTTEKAIDDLPKAAIYGITITSMELLQANRFAEKIKDKYKYCDVVIGGPGTIDTRYQVDLRYIDSVCEGEGEKAILEMVKDWKKGELNGIYWGKPVSNLDKLPLPARHLVPYQGGNIFAYNKTYNGHGSVTILTSRGCPFSCSFCSAPQLNRKVRFRDPALIREEILHVIANYGIKQFRFSDDMFTANEKHVYAICEKIKDLDIAWRVSIRPKPLSQDLLFAMADAGCKEASIGVESFDNNVLAMLDKGTTALDNGNALKMCEKAGIKTRVLFMIRTPGQSEKTVPLNISWLNSVPYNIIACTTFVPLPGSDIWNNPDKYNIEILNRNMDDYNFYFFNKEGENKLKNIIKIKGRSLKKMNEETMEFKEYLKGTGKLNTG